MIRNLAVIGGVLLAVAAGVALGLVPGVVGLIPGVDTGVRIATLPTSLGAGLALSATAAWMYFGAKGKVKERDQLLDRIAWKGDEQVLDVGCGRGLVLVGAAKRLTTGKAVGVDIWQAEDLSGNRPEVPLKNAALEGVGDRVSVQTADMRKLPFPDASFDVVVSRAAIHNIYSAEGREAAIREIARVMRPQGRAAIDDIRHLREYARTFKASGCSEVRLVGSPVVAALAGILTFGSLRPNTMLVRKDGMIAR